jgi:hypothetical protein
MAGDLSRGLYKWQKEKRRPGVSVIGKIPVTGFGSDGLNTLWLLSPICTRRYKFRNGKPYLDEITSEIKDPAIVLLRAKVIGSIKTRFEGDRAFLSADIAIMEYAAALILHDYDMTDADLEMLLPGNPDSAWFKSMCVHACGGEDAIETLGKINPEALRDILSVASTDNENQPT